jgi:pimeloyl-ACP methyl ester carboxylesterase
MKWRYEDTRVILSESSAMDYITFGNGDKPLVILPGLSDGLSTVKGKGFILSQYYKRFWKDFKVYIFSRKNQLKENYTTRDMARDQKRAMEALGIRHCYVMGISQGGMIAQHLAIDYPEAVEKLVIGVSVSRQNSTIQDVVSKWIEFAENNDYATLMEDTMKKTYTRPKIKKYKLLMPILKRVGKPKSFKRFIIQANACLSHHAYDKLDQIQCPTLVIGGDSDQVVGINSSQEMAARIPQSKLIIYEGFGHGAYEEVKNFNEEVIRYLSPYNSTKYN